MTMLGSALSYEESADKANDMLEEILNPTPTMTTEDWNKVRDEEFYVRTVGNQSGIRLLPQMCSNYNNYKVVREKGLRQPHLKGHPHPEGNARLEVKNFNCEYRPMLALEVDWDNVREYIVL